ncbi:MAG: hypothetical protein ACK4UJ_09990 [Leptonema sp. (in: bacteria)]
MKFFNFVIFISLFLLNFCNELSTDQIKQITGKELYSRRKTIEMFQIASLYQKEKCLFQDPLNYMINKGFANFFTKSFYFKSSVDGCLILYLILDCPESSDIGISISYYKNFLFNCKLESYP